MGGCLRETVKSRLSSEYGKEVSWSQLMERAEHPAATIPVDAPSRLAYYIGGGIALLLVILIWQGVTIGKTAKGDKERSSAGAHRRIAMISVGRLPVRPQTPRQVQFRLKQTFECLVSRAIRLQNPETEETAPSRFGVPRLDVYPIACI